MTGCLSEQTTVALTVPKTLFLSSPGFDDAFRCIERLSMYVFDLPVDAAVKQFQNMSEAF